MAKGTDVNFEYISNERYIIETQDIETGRVYYTKRTATLAKAVRVASEYNLIADLSTKIFDTKTGEIIQRGEIC